MFLKHSERRRISPYLALTVGALTVIGAANVVKCAKNIVRCGKEKITCVVRGVTVRKSDEATVE